MNIRILRAEEHDAGKILAAKIHAFREEVELYGEGPPDYDSIDRQRKSIRDGYYFKILDNDRIIGGMGIRDKGEGHYWIGSIFVDIEFQNKGIGTLAMKFLGKDFPDANRWSLETPHRSFRNHHFYEKHGFVKVGETEPDERKNGFFLFLYEKRNEEGEK